MLSSCVQYSFTMTDSLQNASAGASLPRRLVAGPVQGEGDCVLAGRAASVMQTMQTSWEGVEITSEHA